MTRCFLASVLREQVHLAPDVVEQLMGGGQPQRLTLLWLMRHDIPALWPQQRQMVEQFK